MPTRATFPTSTLSSLCSHFPPVNLLMFLSQRINLIYNMPNYKVSLTSTTQKIETFNQGIWGISLPLHLLAVAGYSCCDLQYVGVYS